MLAEGMERMPWLLLVYTQERENEEIRESFQEGCNFKEERKDKYAEREGK